MLYKFLSFPFIFSLFLVTTSCSKDNEQVETPFVINIQDNKNEICINITLDESIGTRCFNSHVIGATNSYFEENNMIPEDYCDLGDDLSGCLSLAILYDGEITYSNFFNFSQNFTSDETVKNIQKDSNSISLTLKLDKKMDPSKIIFLVESLPLRSYVNSRGGIFRSTDYGKLLDSDNFASIYVSSSMPDYFCTYYKKHKLSYTNDWNDIDTKIILNRLNSDIIILTTQDDSTIPSIYRKSQLISSTLITEDNIINIAKVHSTLNTIKIISDARFNYFTFRNCKYFIKDNLTTFTTETLLHNTSSTKGNRWSGMTGASPWTIGPSTLPVVNYQGNEYRFLSTTSLLGNNTGNIYTPDLEPLKYVTLLMQEYGTYPYDSDAVHWTSIPLPEDGIKPNTRYIYILGNDFKLWENSSTRGILKNTVSTRTSSEKNTIQKDSFTIIEQSMDEPLPFERKENN